MGNRRGFLLGIIGLGVTLNVGRRLSENSSQSNSGTDVDSSSDATDSDSSFINEDSNFNTEPEEDTESIEESDTTFTLIDETNRRIGEGEYLYWGFELPESVELELWTTVRDGPTVDVIVTNPDEFSQFERGNRYRYNEEISQENTVGDITSFRFPEGEYVIFISNYQYSTATVDIELTATS